MKKIAKQKNKEQREKVCKHVKERASRTQSENWLSDFVEAQPFFEETSKNAQAVFRGKSPKSAKGLQRYEKIPICSKYFTGFLLTLTLPPYYNKRFANIVILSQFLQHLQRYLNLFMPKERKKTDFYEINIVRDLLLNKLKIFNKSLAT